MTGVTGVTRRHIRNAILRYHAALGMYGTLAETGDGMVGGYILPFGDPHSPWERAQNDAMLLGPAVSTGSSLFHSLRAGTDVLFGQKELTKQQWRDLDAIFPLNEPFYLERPVNAVGDFMFGDNE